MYAPAALVGLAPIAVLWVARSPSVSSAMGLAVAVTGLQGKRLYLAHARSVIARVSAYAADESEADMLIRKAGGVSPAGAWIGGVILACLVMGPPLLRFLAHPR